MIIDFHTHVFPSEVVANRDAYIDRDSWFAECYGNPKTRLADGEALLASMDRAGIDKSVVCGFCWRDNGLCSYHNDYIIDIVHQYPHRLIGFGVAQPADRTGGIAEVERCIASGLRGIGELNADAQGIDLDDADSLQPFVSTLVELGVPLLLHSSEPVGHLYPGKGSIDPRILYRFVSRFPDLRLVCAHWGGGLPFYELMPEVAAVAGNVSYDTSASTLLYDPRVFSIVTGIVGQHKILFGTDFPLLRQDRFITRVRELNLADQVLDDILGGNAERMLRLD